MALRFLALESVLEIHRYQIETFGGSHGLRDSGLLESAVAMPMATFGGKYLHPDLWEMAAAYLFHIVQNHPFVDGNKRVGAASAAIFLVTNGQQMLADPDEFAELTLSVARGETEKRAIAQFFRDNTRQA